MNFEDNFNFDSWSDNDFDFDLGFVEEAQIFEEKKQELQEKIIEHQLTTSKAKPKRISKPTVEKNNAKRARNKSAEGMSPERSLLNHQEDDAIFKHLLPHIPSRIRTDAMAAFPSAFANCLNSGNHAGLADLMRGHLDYQCDIRLLWSNSLSRSSFLKFFELMDDIHPDRIMHVSTTTIAQNKVTAALYMKYTDRKSLYHAVASSVTDPALRRIVPATRVQYLTARMHLENQPQEVQQKMTQLVDSDLDIVVYGCIYVTLTFDPVTRKATALQMAGNLFSAHIA